MEPVHDEEDTDITANEQKIYEAACRGQTASTTKRYAAALKSFAAFLLYAQGKGGSLAGLPALVKDVTEEQWLVPDIYLQHLKWLAEEATWSKAKLKYAPKTILGYFRAVLTASYRNLVDSYKAAGRALPPRVERFFSVLDSGKNSWTGIAEFNMERDLNQMAIEGGKEPTGFDGEDSPPLEFEDVRSIVLSYARHGSQESLLRAVLLLDTYQTCCRATEPIATPWFLVMWSRRLKAVTLRRYQRKTGKTKWAVWLPAAPTDAAGAPVCIYLALGQLAATGYFNTACASSWPAMYPSRYATSDSSDNDFMTSILCVAFLCLIRARFLLPCPSRAAHSHAATHCARARLPPPPPPPPLPPPAGATSPSTPRRRQGTRTLRCPG
jgi:hypothetical protein